MPAPEPLDRAPLRDRIAEVLRRRILAGVLAPGETVRDGELAESLGASRTPVREALIRLSAEGLVEARVGRGFRVRPLERRELEELHPLIATLEPLALEVSAPCSAAQAAALERIVGRMEDAEADAERRHALDADWHRALIAGCGNERLLHYVEEIRAALQRYETAWLAGVVGMELSVAEHRAIAAAFCAGERARATELLRAHWRRGLDELLAIVPKETDS